jgi:hypothetical protein
MKSWLVDTGCKFDLTSRGAISSLHEGLVTEAERLLNLSAAGGCMLCDKAAAPHIGVLGEEVNPALLTHCR